MNNPANGVLLLGSVGNGQSACAHNYQDGELFCYTGSSFVSKKLLNASNNVDVEATHVHVQLTTRPLPLLLNFFSSSSLFFFKCPGLQSHLWRSAPLIYSEWPACRQRPELQCLCDWWTWPWLS
jgi:hypothetical protein